MLGLTADELTTLKKLRTPEKIQKFLDEMPMNFESKGETCMSPRRVLKERLAHCMEGAMLAALALRIAGKAPLVLDLKSCRGDDDHIVALFFCHGCVGAISKTNHGVLRYRDPIYKTVRELALSYFHEYFLPDGKKTLRSYSEPVDLRQFDHLHWPVAENDLWAIPKAIDRSPHQRLLTPAQEKLLRKADTMERLVGEFSEWDRKGKRHTAK